MRGKVDVLSMLTSKTFLQKNEIRNPSIQNYEKENLCYFPKINKNSNATANQNNPACLIVEQIKENNKLCKEKQSESEVKRERKLCGT